MDMDRWLPVTISDGLFPSERTVCLRTAEGDLSLFVATSSLDEGGNTVRVQLLDQDDRFALVQVPSQGDTTVAKVELSEVRTRSR